MQTKRPFRGAPARRVRAAGAAGGERIRRHASAPASLPAVALVLVFLVLLASWGHAEEATGTQLSGAIRQLTDKNPSRRRTAALDLGNGAGADKLAAIAPLISTLRNDKNAEVRAAAAWRSTTI